MRTLLVTGGGGFLGQHFAAEFKRAGWRVLGMGRSLPAQAGLYDENFWQVTFPSDDLCRHFQETQPDLIIHTAGTSSIAFSLQQPWEDLLQNVVHFYHLLDQLRLSGCRARVLQISSAAVYGQPAHFPITEETPLNPVSPYGYHKLQAELVTREFHQLHGIPICNLRIFSAYGTGLKRQVIWELCRKALATGQFVLEGTGLEERDFIHARDVAKAALLITEKGTFDGSAYNIAVGTSRRINEVAACIGKFAGLSQEPRFEGRVRSGNPPVWRVEPVRLGHLGFVPTVSLEQGLKENVEWCRSQLS